MVTTAVIYFDTVSDCNSSVHCKVNHTNKLLFECRSFIKVSATMNSVADKIRAPVTGAERLLG